MAVIYLTHPIHGAKVAVSESEANYDELSNWTRYTPGTPVEAVASDAGEEAAPKRRGRPRAKQED